MNQIWLYISMGASLLSIGVALYLFYWVRQQTPGSERAQEVASWIREGSQTYLKRLYMTLAIVAVILGFIIAIVFSFDLSDVTQGEVSITPFNGVRMALSFRTSTPASSCSSKSSRTP